jgi:hypothetical protein
VGNNTDSECMRCLEPSQSTASGKTASAFNGLTTTQPSQ